MTHSRRLSLVFVFLILLISALQPPRLTVMASTTDPDRPPVDRSKKLVPDASTAARSLSFEPNVGQTDPRVRFQSRARNSAVFLTDTALHIALPRTMPADDVRTLKRSDEATPASASRPATLTMHFDGARDQGQLSPENALEGRVNDLRGNDPSRWRTDIPTFGAVRYHNLYEGIDAVVYGNQQHLEYDLVVRPGADLSNVRVRFEGQQSAELTPEGDLVLRIDGQEIRQRRPSVFQHVGGGKRPVSAHYALRGDGAVTFDVGEYDRSTPLVIDPVLRWVTFSGGGQQDDRVQDIALCPDGSVIAVGETHTREFPTTPGALDTAFNPVSVPTEANSDAFVTKLSADGSTLIFSTFLGGAFDEEALGVTVASDGRVIVGGHTTSPDFPTTALAFDQSFGGGNFEGTDGFLVSLNANGTAAIFSSFFGGSRDDAVRSVITDAAGTIGFTGETRSSDFPVTAGAFQPVYGGGFDRLDAFVARIAPDGVSLVYSSFLGGQQEDSGGEIHVEANGTAYVVGKALSLDFPTTPGAYQTTSSGLSFFVTKITPAGDSLVYSTFAGLCDDAEQPGLAVKNGFVWFTGITTSGTFPVTPGAYDTTYNSSGEPGDAVVVKMSQDGSSLLFGSYLGGANADRGTAIAINGADEIIVTGSAESTNFPTTAGAYQTVHRGGISDGFVTKFAASGASLVYSTFVGGYYGDTPVALDVDASGSVYVGGHTASFDFPVTSGALDQVFNGLIDAFVFRLNPAASSMVFSTLLDGPAEDVVGAVHVRPDGYQFVVGSTPSFDFLPACCLAPFDDSQNGGLDVFVLTHRGTGGPDGMPGSKWLTFLGGSSDDVGSGVTVNGDGRIVVTGTTQSANFPVTPGVFDTTHNGGGDAFVALLSADGQLLVASTFLGGAAGDAGLSVTTDLQRAVYVGGRTASSGFPTTGGAFDTSLSGGGDGFVVKLSSALTTLQAGSFLGGAGANDSVNSVALSTANRCVVAGETNSADFPTTAGAFDSSFGGDIDVFVARFDPAISSLDSSTYLGGTGSDRIGDLDVDQSGVATVCGETSSPDFPLTPGAIDTTRSGASDGFVSRLPSTGFALQTSTLLGGSGSDVAREVVVDGDGTIYVGGDTTSADFVTGGGNPGTVDPTYNGGGGDGFVALLNPAASSVVFATYVGGTGLEQGCRIGVDGARQVYMVGQTASFELPHPELNFHTGTDLFLALVEFPEAAEFGRETIGVYVASSGTWFVRFSNAPGGADRVFSFGPGGAGFLPLVGDWDGDGDDTPGIYHVATGAFFLRNELAGGPADIVFTYGAGGAGILPLAGDWNDDGVDTIGIYVESTGAFLLRNSNTPGPADLTFTFGPGGANVVPITGSWQSGLGDSIGIYNKSAGAFFLKLTPGPGAANLVYTFGPPNLTPVTGKWGQIFRTEYVGCYVSGSGTWFLRYDHAPGPADLAFSYGPPGAVPVVGNWAGR